ncbi:MAG: glycosyltransferase 87 family protein [Candidatus Pacearchaeota archaeon]
MKNIKLDSILLFALVIPFIMTYRLSPGDTPYWLFGLIFLGLLSYVVLDLLNLKDKLQIAFKNSLLWVLIIVVIGSAFYSAIIVRHQTVPEYGIHDMPLQQEIAIRFLLHGQNPYSATYFKTPLERWNYSEKEKNPALYHFVTPPFYILFAIPFYLVTAHGFPGFFDARIPLLFLFFILLITAGRLVKDEDKKRQFLILLSFNPATLGYFLEGRDDVFMFSFLFVGLYLLYKKKDLLAGILLALAFAVKQSVWPVFPFYFAYLYFKNKNLSKTIIQLIPFTVMFSVVVLPFFFWNPIAYLDSTIFYLSGNTLHSYPISGYGLGSVLKEFGLIKDAYSYYPFWIWQVAIGLPLIMFLIKWQKKENTVQRLILIYGIFLFIFWYFLRYLNNSHLGYLSMVFITAYFWPKAKEV